MSATTLPYAQALSSAPLAVSLRVVLSLYAIIPLSFLLYGFDSYFLQGYLLDHLPSNPSHFLLFQILFGTPHIVASTIILCSNREYLLHFRTPIVAMTLLIILVFGVGSLFVSYRTLYIISVVWTVLHVLKQQHGIAKGVCRLSDGIFYTLLGLSVAAGICIYLGIFLRNSLEVDAAQWLQHSAASLTMALFVVTLFTHRLVTTRFGHLWLWGNSALVFASYYFYVHHHPFLAILIPRLVHDATAYIFYVTHDYNRHRPQAKNKLYQLTQRCAIPIVIVLPLLSFAVAYLLQNYGDALVSTIALYLFNADLPKAVTLGFIGYLSLMHYYSESLTWKQGSPYRQFIRFKQ